MGNRKGSPPDRGEEEQPEEQPQNESHQTDLSDATGDKGTESSKQEGSETTASGGSGGTVAVSAPPSSESESPSDDNHSEEDESSEGNDIGEPCPDETPDDEQDDSNEEFEFVYGDIVNDREVEDSVDYVVVTLPNKTISEWKYNDDETIADRNPGYPPSDDLIIVAEREELEDTFPDWDKRTEEISLSEFDDQEVEYSAFPSIRLVLVGPSHLRL